MQSQTLALLELGRCLERAGYEFVTITPESQRRVLARRRGPDALGRSPRDVFGWNLDFEASALPSGWLELLVAADACERSDGRYRSKIRFSTCAGRLFAHSAYPTTEADSVFFGPDTYRFCSLLERCAPRAKRAVDVGCGSGAGGLMLASNAEAIVLTDINERALAFSRVNAELAQTPVEVCKSDVLESVSGPVDLIVANPPYLRDPAHRLYRDGGGAFGEGLALRIVREALRRLEPGGTLLLYTGAPIVEGEDCFFEQARPLLEERGASFEYFELDPDVFGEELSSSEYASVDRLAAVALCARIP
jgi:SAM-dependent methyltransferase